MTAKTTPCFTCHYQHIIKQ